MKTVNFDETKKTVIIDGKEFDIVERKPVDPTLEECVYTNTVNIIWNGDIDSSGFHPSPNGKALYPTESEAEKVMLYGLLRSVAWKLNGGKATDTYSIELGRISESLIISNTGGRFFIDPLFSTRELAEQAIRIFAASKYDLKKLYQ